MSHPALPTSREFITRLLQSIPSVDTTSNISASNPLHLASETTKRQLLALHVLVPNEFLPALDLLDRRLVTRYWIHDHSRVDTSSAVAPVETVGDASFTTELRSREHISENEEAAQSIEVDTERGGEGSKPSSSGATGSIDADTEMIGAMLPISQLEESLHPLWNGKEGLHIKSEEEDQAAQYSTRKTKEDKKGKDTVYYVRSAQQRPSRFSASYDSTTTYEVRLTAWNCSCPAFAFAAFPSTFSDLSIPAHESHEEQSGGGNAALDMRKRQKDAAWSFGGVSLGPGIPPVCKHLLACVLVERCAMFAGFLEEKEVSVDEAAGWAAGWGD
ncbi:hypothetical protein K505DRAFT_325418 [Melanomma pulvis-pyrius CBS 109.77]|uniref:SWIM-type domain-containing protein n=1 Tax=Melanomma pulvis-pyrius CBS 109.77 TaxID=1314802 RepID=A0A6A6XBG6_9PLEO|nr:hypothetical protein K505DRAFT_325418 [Melanomma pulvis-pyrius CBS 109.77]